MHNPCSILTGSVGVAALVLSGLVTAQAQSLPPVPQSLLEAFDTSKGTTQELSLPKTSIPGFEVDVNLGGKTYTLILREHNVRAKGFKLMVSDAKGMHQVPTPTSTTYRGKVLHDADSMIAATLFEGQLRAFISLDRDDAPWCVVPVSDVVKSAKRTTHISYHGKDSTAPQGKCGTMGGIVANPVPNGPVLGSNGPKWECDILADSDFEMYLSNGSSVSATQNNVAGIINACTVIYTRDCDIEYKISLSVVRTTTTYTSNNYITLLNQFRSQWVNNGTNRDVAHLFTGKSRTSSVVGAAWLSSICNRSIGYGLSFTNFTSNFTNRVGVTAHEVGHGWSAQHCGGSSCFIMCGGLGGCGRNLTRFGTQSINSIVNFRNSRGCLTRKSSGPVLNSITPVAAQAFRGGQIELKGSGFLKAIYVNVGPARLWILGGFQIVDDSTIRFQSPTAKSLGFVLITVDDTNGRSNGKSIFYQATNPPKLDAYAAPTRGNIMLWEFGATPAHAWFLTVSTSPTTVPFLGYQWLQTPIIVTNATLNGAGYGFFNVTVPSSTMIGLEFWSQVVTLNTSPVTFAGNTNVTKSKVQ